MPFLFQCRTGFEADSAAELVDYGRARHVAIGCRQVEGTAYVEADCAGAEEALYDQLAILDLVFARQWFRVRRVVDGLPEKDRLTPLIEAIHGLQPASGSGFAGILLEHPDTNEGKTLSPWCLQVRQRLEQELRSEGILEATVAAGTGVEDGPGEALMPGTVPPLAVVGTAPGRSEPGCRPRARPRQAAHFRTAERLHLFFPDWTRAWIGTSPVGASSAWPLGVPRLRPPPAAPSRAALKLEEAFRSLLAPGEAKRWLRPGMHAVDLGAAPGGWTYLLLKRGLRVIAVDNAELAPAVRRAGPVLHLRENAYRYRPPRHADWVTCDVVDRPGEVTALMSRWVGEGLARRALFNLKLPMRQRWPMVRDCLASLEQRLAEYGLVEDDYVRRCRHLYHDRREVSVLVARVGR